jgi:hypothetical protein
MHKKIAIIGASVGGLVAAAELQKFGYDVTIFEKGKTVGGLYNKIDTPFGDQELGMHVLYADDRHFSHLRDIFGEEVFNVLSGNLVDQGASTNFDQVYFGSHYPCLKMHPLQELIMDEILERSLSSSKPANAFEEASRRFGSTAASKIIAPILSKLWKSDPTALSPNALHCFFDLRRIVICEKTEADILKDQPELDEVIANPDQLNPKGEIFGGRVGLTFRAEFNDLGDRVKKWAAKVGINLYFDEDVACLDGELWVGGKLVRENFDACIVCVPIHMMLKSLKSEADCMELSIYYFKLAEPIGNSFPSYYILAHDPNYRASRIVNYDAYNAVTLYDRYSVIAVEAVHLPDCQPSELELTQELALILPSIRVIDSYKLSRSITVFSPTLKNTNLLDSFQQKIIDKFQKKPIYFSGMRTDTGIFFSHHTIGLAYDSALACHKQLASN